MSSTNTKIQGSAFSSVYSASLLTKDTTVVIQANDSLLLTASPLWGLMIGLGTLVISYVAKTAMLK